MPASKILEKFGKRVRELRTQRKLTQEGLADKAELHYTYVGQLERSKKNISLKNIEKIAKGLSVSLSEFFSTFR